MLETIKSYDVVIAQLTKNIRGLKAHPKILVKEEHKYLYPVFENAMYIAISASDLIIALKYLDVSNFVSNGLETNYFARNVALISYELINHQQKIVGKDASEVIANKIGTEALLELKKCKKQLKGVISKYKEKLNYIRNNLFGHRTSNGAEMAKSMIEIDSREIHNIGKQIFGVYMNIYVVYVNLLSKI